MALIVPWRSLNIHRTFPFYRSFFSGKVSFRFFNILHTKKKKCSWSANGNCLLLILAGLKLFKNFKTILTSSVSVLENLILGFFVSAEIYQTEFWIRTFDCLVIVLESFEFSFNWMSHFCPSLNNKQYVYFI